MQVVMVYVECNLAVQIIVEWHVDEKIVLLGLYKELSLSSVYRGDFMELSHHMKAAGFDRNNNQCRQVVS